MYLVSPAHKQHDDKNKASVETEYTCLKEMRGEVTRWRCNEVGAFRYSHKLNRQKSTDIHSLERPEEPIFNYENEFTLSILIALIFLLGF
jgi:hypothetical protein